MAEKKAPTGYAERAAVIRRKEARRKRALFAGAAVTVGFAGYCALASSAECLTNMALLLGGALLFALGAFLQERSGFVVPALESIIIVAGVVLVFLGLLGLTKPVWTHLVSENTRLFMAIAKGENKTAISILEKNPAMVNKARYYNGVSLLHQAADWGNYRIVGYLLEKGADVRARDSEGKTPLESAQDAPAEGDLAPNGNIDKAVEMLVRATQTASSAASASIPGTGGGYSKLSEQGLSLEYPSTWQTYSADRAEAVKQTLVGELRKSGVHLLRFAVISDPDDKATLLVMVYSRPEPISPSQLVAERRQVYDEAMRSGDVTKVNYVKETSLANLPAVEEDVYRSNGGRGRTFKVIKGTSVFEVSFVVNDAAEFSQYSNTFNHIVSTIHIGRH